jgi:hypothetical protein
VASIFPASVNERPRIFTTSQPDPLPTPRVARQRTVTFTLRWDRIILSAITGIVFGAMTFWGLSILADQADPWHGVPACTDSIADAGGICHGEPR